MNRTRAKGGHLVWLVVVGALSGGCEEWWGEEEEEDASVDASVDPSTGDAAVDAGMGPADAGPAADAATPDAAAPADAAVVDASPELDAAPDASADTGPTPPDAAPDAAPEPAPDAAPDAAPGPGDELPCDVEQALIARCQSCHGSPPTSAPIPLVTLADLKATSTAGGFVYQRVQVRIDNNTMPPSWSTTGALTAEEKTALTTWIAAGAPGSSTVCP